MPQYEPVSPRSEAAAKEVVDAAIQVHRALGPGLLESVYEQCLHYELTTRGVIAERQVAVPVRYKAVEIDAGFRLDLLVDGVLVVELKAVDALAPLHDAQLLTYLKLTGLHLGLLLNFNVPRMKDGLKRLVNTRPV